MTALVSTALGDVQGDVKHGVAAWRGIPYAEPPVGELRFLPPRPPRPWTGVHDGTRYGNVAVQSREPRSAMMSGITDKMSMGEDCLVLNVFAPAGYADGKKRPVLVWIHGGAFVMGAGSLPLYHGGTFTTHDLVVVTINYRLGFLGLMYLGDVLGEPYAAGNVALLDQVAALRWVREHIAAFGGDPAQVTVMGESAGAVGVAHLLAMPAAKGLFARAILQSGAPGLIPPSRADATASATSAIAELGVPATAAALRDVPVEKLLAAQDVASRTRGLAAFSPYVDGVTVPVAPREAVRAGSAAGVPVLLGSNRDEWALFHVFLGAPVTQLLIAQLRGRLGGFADVAHARYVEARADRSPENAWVDVLGDLAFRIPMIRLAEEQVAHAPVYMYRFDFASKGFDGRLGAAHALELPFVWNRLDNPLSQLLLGGSDTAAQALATRMHATWAAFVRTGAPDGDWPRYDAARRATLIYDRDVRVADDPDGATRALWPRL